MKGGRTENQRELTDELSIQNQVHLAFYFFHSPGLAPSAVLQLSWTRDYCVGFALGMAFF